MYMAKSTFPLENVESKGLGKEYDLQQNKSKPAEYSSYFS